MSVGKTSLVRMAAGYLPSAESGKVGPNPDRGQVRLWPVEWLHKRIAKHAASLMTVFRRFLVGTSRLKRGTIRQEPVRQIKSLMSEGKYGEAVRFGRKVRRELIDSLNTGSSLSPIAIAELDVNYGLALIYSGVAEEGIAVLEGIVAQMEGGRSPEDVASQSDPLSDEGQQRNWVLGRAHNNIGYAYWMEQGRYKLALREFHAALPYFHASYLREECANTRDNMGRVYALLCQRSQAELWIDSSLDTRCDLEHSDRVALSLNSRAIAHLTFGEPQRAQELSTEALTIFEHLGKQRGIGLACITLGSSLRRLGTPAGLSQAVGYLERAMGIFEQSVPEPVRLIEACKELGCVYRDLGALAHDRILNPFLAEGFDYRAVSYLRTANKLAEWKTSMLYVDSCIDLAQTYLQGQQLENAEAWLGRAEQTIPDIYMIQACSGLDDVPVEERVERFWYFMGRIELLRGRLALDRGLSSSSGRISRKVLVLVTQHCVFATTYFRQYSEEILGQTVILRRIYDCFKHCRPDDIRHVQEKVVPTVTETYAINAAHSECFKATLDLALRCVVSRRVGRDRDVYSSSSVQQYGKVHYTPRPAIFISAQLGTAA